MIKQQIVVFIARTLVSILGIWLCITWFGTVDTEPAPALFILAGLILALLNSIVKPLITIFALPLAVVTMGISTVLINVAMVALTILLLPDVHMDFWGAFFSSIILSIINGLANLFMPGYAKPKN